MQAVRGWWGFFRRVEGWWRKGLILLLTGLVLWLLVLGGMAAVSLVLSVLRDLWAVVAAFGRRLFVCLLDAMPLLILLTLLTHMMGKVGKTIRKGTVELINKVVVGLFALVGVHIAEEKKRRKEDDGDR